MGTKIESPGPFRAYDGNIDQFSKELNAYRLVQTGAIPDLAGIKILEVPSELQTISRGE